MLIIFLGGIDRNITKELLKIQFGYVKTILFANYSSND